MRQIIGAVSSSGGAGSWHIQHSVTLIFDDGTAVTKIFNDNGTLIKVIEHTGEKA